MYAVMESAMTMTTKANWKVGDLEKSLIIKGRQGETEYKTFGRKEGGGGPPPS
jgi:hypothetical protein